MSRLPLVRAGDPLADLTEERRARERDELAAGTHVDVLVVGGGVTGVGVALDAAARGLSVALVERRDLAFGTSRWSSKLVHGGLRYLAHGDVGVVWESAVERAVLMGTVVPHLTRPLAQVVPLMSGSGPLLPALVGLGFVAGTAFARAARTPRALLPPPRLIGAAAMLRAAPTLDARRVRGGIVNYDGQLEDDARLVVALARTAAAHGARILTGTAAVEVGPGGAVVEDTDGGSYAITAQTVVNATGVWAGSLDAQVRVLPSRGTHVVLRAAAFGHPRAALTVPVPGGGSRFVFALPQPDGLVLAGITDVPADGPISDVPEPSPAEIAWILEVISTVLDKPLSPADAVGAFAGLRPLVAPEDHVGDGTADISRRHLIRTTGDGMVTVTGGKLTTYRRMAQDVVDLLTDVPCSTAQLPLLGAGALDLDAARAPARLRRRFGTEAGRVAALADGRPSLLEPLAPDVPVLGVELVHGVLHEGARDLDDLLARRTRVALVPDDLAAAMPRAEEALAAALRRN